MSKKTKHVKQEEKKKASEEKISFADALKKMIKKPDKKR